MTVTLSFPKVTLDEEGDFLAAKQIEAGLYANHLLATRPGDTELALLSQIGEEAAERLWWVGARLAFQQAQLVAKRFDLPFDDLFQDGCIAVADAIQRYDYKRGIRFTTFAYQLVELALRNSERHRCNAAAVNRQDKRAARLARTEQRRRAEQGESITLEAAAAHLGLAPASAMRGTTRLVALDPQANWVSPENPYACIEGPGTSFLELLSNAHRQVLTLRYGLSGSPLTQVECARKLRTSPSTISRLERQALQEAARLLASERTRSQELPLTA